MKIFEAGNRSFHLKSYIFVRSDIEQTFYKGTAFIGSNNISKTALTDAHEWCLRFDHQDPMDSYQARQFQRIRDKFAELFAHPQAKVLNDDWLTHYIKIRQQPIRATLPLANVFEEPEYIPNSAQQEALAALADSREQGYQRGLVVLATGMGKTWLAAFDAKQMQAKRVLFVAHRQEILKQALNTFAKLWMEKSSAIFDGATKDKALAAQKDMVFASVQTLARANHLQRFQADDFDYVVIDEFHHADAKSYRLILDYFKPKFLLGLTATPERPDQANILTLCHDNLVFERNLVHGIDAKILVPFHYYGIWDETVDYTHIPWRNGKFDPHSLDAEFMTRKRALHIFEHWQQHKQQCTLAFCVSRNHADYMAEQFNQHFAKQGSKAASVHSQSKLRRNEALTQLEEGQIDVLFCVDLFNEGTDLPLIDTILMLRPTESGIIFLQQLGRGLRLHPNKQHLVVLDFIGNHSSFLNKQQTLITHTHRQGHEQQQGKNELTIAEGCAINIDLKITEFWQRLQKQYRNTALEDYQLLFEQLGHQPSALAFYQADYELKKVNQQHGSWWQMIACLSAEQALIEVVNQHHLFLFHAVQQASMSKSFKMILLEAFINLDGLKQAVSYAALAEQSKLIIAQYPIIFTQDLAPEKQQLAANDPKWLKYWKDNPIKFSQTQGAKEPQAWFVTEIIKGEEYLKLNFEVAEGDTEMLKRLIQELIDLRLAQYVERKRKK